MTGRYLLPLAGVAALALAGCSSEEAAPVAEAVGDCVPGIVPAGGWLALPAVAGNPAAAYFTLENTSDRQVTIRAAEVLGTASGMLHQTSEWSGQVDMQELIQVPVMPGETVTFAPGGMHVMAMQPGETLQAGGETEITLTFVGGDKCSFPASIHAAGDDPREAAD